MISGMMPGIPGGFSADGRQITGDTLRSQQRRLSSVDNTRIPKESLEACGENPKEFQRILQKSMKSQEFPEIIPSRHSITLKINKFSVSKWPESLKNPPRIIQSLGEMGNPKVMLRNLQRDRETKLQRDQPLEYHKNTIRVVQES